MNSPSADAVTAPVRARRWSALEFSDSALSAAKWLAMVLMVIDHTNKYLFSGAEGWMFAMGRVSMPLFAFVLGYNLARPGLLEHGGYRRVALRLLAFGLVASPFFIALDQRLGGVGWWPLNMLFTLLVAVLGAWLLDKGTRTSTVAACLVLCWGGALGEYWWPAIGLVLFIWAYKRQPSGARALGFVLCLVLLYVVNGNFWALAALPVLASLSFFPVTLPRVKWLFYGFYPLHLALLWWYLTRS